MFYGFNAFGRAEREPRFEISHVGRGLGACLKSVSSKPWILNGQIREQQKKLHAHYWNGFGLICWNPPVPRRGSLAANDTNGPACQSDRPPKSGGLHVLQIGPTRPNSRFRPHMSAMLHLGANKAPGWAQHRPTWLQLRPNLAPTCRNLAPSLD